MPGWSRNRVVLLGLAGALTASLAACGEGSKGKAGTSQLSPTQYDNAQRIGGYIRALNKVEAPFTHPSTEPTNYTKAAQLLRANIAELASITPPEQFRATQAKLVRGLRRELATTPEFERGKRTHNPIAINNAEAKNVEAEHVVREALAEGGAVLSRCQHDSFSC